jgi:hypothetical protein
MCIKNYKFVIFFSFLLISLCFAYLLFSIRYNTDSNPNINLTNKIHTNNDSIPGLQSTNGNIGFNETVSQIMERNKFIQLENIPLKSSGERKKKYPNRSNLPQNPESKFESAYPPAADNIQQQNSYLNPQAIGTNFNAISLSETGFIPADNMGAVGPSQIIAMANGRIKSFSKSTGVADGILNTTTDYFFNSVRNGAGTSDPRIKYDRLTQRWFVVIINTSSPNRILIAVSNTSVITISTVWTFFFINAPGEFIDYPTMGLDNNAIYIGTNNFNTALNTFLQCTGYVIRKSDLLSGILTFTYFAGLCIGSSAGPFTPQGVDNFDPTATEGYFIGVDNTTFGTLMLRRVSNPGTSPSISANIPITVNATTFPVAVTVLGSTRPLDALDDRLFAACMRNGRLWTAHNFRVTNTGVATTLGSRVGTRWYEIQNLNSTPAVVQSGTIFDPSSSNPICYWIPTVMVSGQGHAAFIYSSAGPNNRVNVSTSGRLSGDVLGTTQAITNITNTTFNYNVQTSGTQRWGDYSMVCIDPDDNMSMWGFMGYCDANNSYGVRAVKLLAPPPPPLTSANPPSVNIGQPSVNVIITGTPVSGEGFYDPGSGFANRISASINGGVIVNSVTYNSPTQVTLNISTMSASTGGKTVTITNPDGQSSSSSVIFDTPLPVVLSSFNSSISNRDVTLYWSTELEINNKGFDIERKNFNQAGDNSQWQKIAFISGKGNSNIPQNYQFTDKKLNSGKYNYRLKQIDYNGSYEYFNLSNDILIGTPLYNELSQNYPNPFNPITKIDYAVVNEGHVNITIYDISGREVMQIVNESKTPGFYTVSFDASALASGVYFYRLTASSFTQIRKMLVVK